MYKCHKYDHRLQNPKRTPIVVFNPLVSQNLSAQRYEVVRGELANLKGITAYRATFSYDDLEIYGFASEQAFLEDKMAKRAANPGKAEKFRADWFAYRKEKYEPRFIAYFNKRFAQGEIVLFPGESDNPYTMHIKTTWLYPGYGIGIGGEPTKISALVTVFETAHPEHVLFAIKFDKAIGFEDKNLNDPGDRISGAYEKLAKNMVLELKRVF